MKSNSEKISYCIGFQAGENIKSMLQGTDAGLLSKGFNDSIGKLTPILKRREIEGILKVLGNLMQQLQKKIIGEVSAKNKEHGVTFFEKINSGKGVKSLIDGIKYEIIKSGSGEMPSKDCSIIIHIKAAHLDGTVMENSFDKETPLQFHISKIVLPGLSKALSRMKVGDRWRLFLPSEQAFGINGLPEKGIEPGFALIYEVELLQIIKSEANIPTV